MEAATSTRVGHNYALTDYAQKVVDRDFDGDGKPDMITTFSDGQHQVVNLVLNASE